MSHVSLTDRATLGTGYDLAGNMARQTDGAGHTTIYAYDALNRPESITDPLGRKTLYRYDGAGNRTSLSNPDGQVTRFGYDDANQLTSIAYSDGHTPNVSNIQYDPNGLRVAMTDGTGSSVWAYDSLNRLTSSTDGSGAKVGYGYDLKGQNTGITYPGGRAVTRAFDAAGNLNLVKDWLGNRTTFAYDPNNNLVTQQYANATKGTFDYDQADRLMGIDYTRKVETNQTPSTGPGPSNPPTASGSTVSNSALGRSAAGGQVPSKTPGGRSAAPATTSGRLPTTGVFILAGVLIAILLILVGLVLRGRAPGGTTFVVFLLMMAALADSMAYPGTAAAESSSTRFLSFSYERDSAAQLTAVTSTGVPADNNQYGYTALNQLKSVNASTYGYDPSDNLTHLATGTTQSYDSANQLCWSAPTESSSSCGSPPSGSTTFSYDPRGNRVRMAPPNKTPVTYSYDQANRLTEIGGIGSYAYNGDGLRMSKTVAGMSEPFVWDVAGGLPMLLKDGTTSFIYGPGGLPLEQVSDSGSVSYFHHDQLGSTRALTDESGDVVMQASYDAYGNVTATMGSATTPFGYAGQYTDPESGLQYLRARYYDPTTGQFLARDPLGTFAGNPYAYVDGDPLNGTDPTGLFTIYGSPASPICTGIVAPLRCKWWDLSEHPQVKNKLPDYVTFQTPFGGGSISRTGEIFASKTTQGVFAGGVGVAARAGWVDPQGFKPWERKSRPSDCSINEFLTGTSDTAALDIPGGGLLVGPSLATVYSGQRVAQEYGFGAGVPGVSITRQISRLLPQPRFRGHNAISW